MDDATAYTWADVTDTRTTDVEFNSCNPPIYGGTHRGNYFDGTQHSIDIGNLYQSFYYAQTSFVFYPMEFDFTLYRA